MVWAGTTAYARWNKQGVFEYSQTGFDADAEEGTVIDLLDYIGLRPTGYIPKYANLWATATHATEVTDTVSLKLQASVDGVNYDDLAEVTDADLPNAGTTTGYSDVIAATTFPTLAYRYFKMNCVTVGLGNTLAGFAKIW